MRIEKQGQVIKVIEVLKISYKSIMQTRIIYMYFKQKLKAALKGKIISTFGISSLGMGDGMTFYQFTEGSIKGH